jgi:hypothetical protein
MPDAVPPHILDAQPESATFIERCLRQEYAETPEPRNWNDSTDFRRILDPLNGQKYEQACREAEALLSTYPDLDLIYSWFASALLKQKHFEQAAAIARDGLSKSKRKYTLCVTLGDIAWETGNLADTVYWWMQAWHCQESLPGQGGDNTIFLYLSYIASELKLDEIADALVQRADRLRFGQIRLAANTASTLRTLARSGNTAEIQFVLHQMAKKYFAIKAIQREGETSVPAERAAWVPGRVLQTPGRLEIGLIEGLIRDENRSRPLLEEAWVIPCLKVEEQRYQVQMTRAQKTSLLQACVLDGLPPGEYLIAYNPFPVEDEQDYCRQWDGKILDCSSAAALFASLSLDGRQSVETWQGPRGGTLLECGQVLEIKANTAVGVKAGLPLVVEFLADQKPYTAQVMPGQTGHFILRSHACAD